MAQTAELVRSELRGRSDLSLMQAVGIDVDVGYTRTVIWLDVSGRTVSRLEWMRWWEPGFSTREDRAREIAHRLLVEWMQGRGREPIPEAGQ